MKPLQYKDLICTELAHVALILELLFHNDLLEDYDALIKNVMLPVPTHKDKNRTSSECAEPAGLFEQLIRDNGHPDITYEDELHRFLHATATVDGSIDVLPWWKLNTQSFPSIEKVARVVLPIPSSSVAS